jgi:hypothetical protein
MKKLIFNLVFPLTFFSYIIFEKWWYVYIYDGPDKTLFGFPLINCCPSLATSMEWDYYIFETIINVATFSIFWFSVVFVINKYVKPIRVSNLFGKISFVLLILYAVGFTYISIEFNTKFFLKRDFKVKVVDKGYHFIWNLNLTIIK